MVNPSELEPLRLFLYCYLACGWCSFGLYAVSSDEWEIKRMFATTIHGANTGMIFALLSVATLGFSKPWAIIGGAASTSIGWTSKKQILDLLGKILK